LSLHFIFFKIDLAKEKLRIPNLKNQFVIVIIDFLNQWLDEMEFCLSCWTWPLDKIAVANSIIWERVYMASDMQEAEQQYEHQLEIIDEIPMERKFWVKNQLLDMGYELTTQEYRLLKTVFSMIKRNDTDFKTYRIKAAKFVEIFKEDEGSVYRTVDKVLSNLKKRVIKVYTMRKDKPNQIEKVEYKNWLSTATYWPNQGVIDISLDKWLKNFFISIKLGRGTDGFTTFLSNETEGLNHYSERIYDLIKKEIFKYLNTQTRTVSPIVIPYDELRRKLDLPLLQEFIKRETEEMDLFSDANVDHKAIKQLKKQEAQQLLENYLAQQLRIAEAEATAMGKKKPKEVTDIPQSLVDQIFLLDPDLRVITNGRGKNKGLGKVLAKRPPNYKLFGDFNVRILKQFFKDMSNIETAPYVHYRLENEPEGIKTGKAVSHIKFNIIINDRYNIDPKEKGKVKPQELTKEQEAILKDLIKDGFDTVAAAKVVNQYEVTYLQKTIRYCRARADKNLGGYIADCLANGYGVRAIDQEEQRAAEEMAKREIELAQQESMRMAEEAIRKNREVEVDLLQSIIENLTDEELEYWKDIYMKDEEISEYQKAQLMIWEQRGNLKNSISLKMYIQAKNNQ
jgi:hypothetical protein